MNNEIERIILRKKSSSNLKISQRQKFKKHLLDLSIWNAICVWSLSEFNGSINRGGLTKMTEFKCLRIRRPRDRYRSGRRRSCAHIIGQFLTNWERPLFEVFLYAFSRFARGNRWIHNTAPFISFKRPTNSEMKFSRTGSSFTLANVALLWPIFPTMRAKWDLVGNGVACSFLLVPASGFGQSFKRISFRLADISTGETFAYDWCNCNARRGEKNSWKVVEMSRKIFYPIDWSRRRLSWNFYWWYIITS